MLGGFDAIIEPCGSKAPSMDFGLNLNFKKTHTKLNFTFFSFTASGKINE